MQHESRTEGFTKYLQQLPRAEDHGGLVKNKEEILPISYEFMAALRLIHTKIDIYLVSSGRTLLCQRTVLKINVIFSLPHGKPARTTKYHTALNLFWFASDFQANQPFKKKNKDIQLHVTAVLLMRTTFFIFIVLFVLNGPTLWFLY